MAVTTTKIQSAMIIKYKTGVDSKGKDVTKNQKFSNVKVSSVDEDILAVGTSIGSLLPYPNVEVSK